MTPATDRQQWYPMRVTYRREQRVKTVLDALHVENFLPASPVGLIFVHASATELSRLCADNESLSSMHHVMTIPADSSVLPEVVRVPDAEMRNYLRVASVNDDTVFALDHVPSAYATARHVTITDGPFAGVEGILRRIGKNRRVVVIAAGLSAVAISYVPPVWVHYID